MIAPFSMEFRTQYNRSFDLYVMGYWQHARKEFLKTQRILMQDIEESEQHDLYENIKD